MTKSSNADRLKKAMAQRSRPVLQKSPDSHLQSFDDIQVDPHHVSITTLASISSCSSTASSVSPITPGSSISLDKQSRSQTMSTGTAYSDFQAPTLCSDISVLSSPTSTGHSEYSRFGRVVANSINSYSSMDSQDSRSGHGRLFEKSGIAGTAPAGPVFVLPAITKTEDEEDVVSNVIGSYQNDFYSLDRLDAHNARLMSQHYTETTYFTKPSKPTPNSRSIYEDHRVESHYPQHPNHQHHASLYESEFNDTEFSDSMFPSSRGLIRRSSMSSLYGRILSTDGIEHSYETAAPVAQMMTPSRPRNRRNSMASDISSRNSLLHTGLTLDLDSVIRSALVESSIANEQQQKARHFRNQPSLEDKSDYHSLHPVMTNAYTAPKPSMAGSFPAQVPEEHNRAESGMNSSTEKRNMGRLGTSMMKKFARKIAN